MPFIHGNAGSGWAVVRNDPYDVAGVFETEAEAQAKARDMGDGYEVRYGSSRGGSGNFDEAL